MKLIRMDDKEDFVPLGVLIVITKVWVVSNQG